MEVHRQYLSEGEPLSLGITQQKPKHPQYSVITKRLDSFANWPEDIPVSADELAECGFVYTGVDDGVRCYYCGGGVRQWEAGDDPWEEHAMWYPHCPHVLLNKGQRFVDRVQNSENGLESDGPLVDETSCTPCQQVDYLGSIAAQSCIQMGYPENCVQRAVEKYIAINGHSNFKGQDLCEIMLDEEDSDMSSSPASSISPASSMSHASSPIMSPESPANVTDCENVAMTTCTGCVSDATESDIEDEEHESLEELYDENCRLKDSRMCKICLDDVASIIFLPCGHMVTCPQCAPAFNKCPLCRVVVNGFVKAYFACS